MLEIIFGELEEILRKEKERLALCGGCDADDGCVEFDKDKVAEIMFNYTIDTLQKLRERIYAGVESVRRNAFLASLSLQQKKPKEVIEEEDGIEYECEGKRVILTGKEKEYYEVADTVLDCVLEVLGCEIEGAIETNKFVLKRIKEGKTLEQIKEEVEEARKQRIIKKKLHLSSVRRGRETTTRNSTHSQTIKESNNDKGHVCMREMCYNERRMRNEHDYEVAYL